MVTQALDDHATCRLLQLVTKTHGMKKQTTKRKEKKKKKKKEK